MFNKITLFGNSVPFCLWLLVFSFAEKKPKVFVLGDSISMQYGPYLKESLKGFYIYDRKRGEEQPTAGLDNPVGANGGDSGMVLAYLRELNVQKDFYTDILLLNCGLHDIKTNPQTNIRQVGPEAYLKNLRQIVKLVKKMKIRLVWVSTTPVVDEIHNSQAGFHRYEKDVKQYNRIAEDVMRSHGIPVIDLHDFTVNLGVSIYKDHVHFIESVREKQADFIAGYLSGLN